VDIYRKKLLGGLFVALLGLFAFHSASAQDNSNALVKFKGGIGVIPVTGVAANGTVNLNVVRGVSPGAPWRITDLEAEITFDRSEEAHV